MNTVELRQGPMRLALRPDLGGCIAGLWFGEHAVLRSAPPSSLEGPRGSGSFPLAPYSNRLANRRFEWLGRGYTTASNFDTGYPHSLHGSVWTKPWRMLAADDSTAALACRQPADEHWPFPFEAVQMLRLSEQGLHASLSLTNTHTQPQPMGLGWHPYFPRRSRSRLHLECTGRWECEPATKLPTHRVLQSSIDADVRHLDYDHHFDGWRSKAWVRDEKLSVVLTSSLEHVVVYTPPTSDYFCVEPVSHLADAIHREDPKAHGLRIVEPGETMQAWMQIGVERVHE
jgi:aldose 1-epimerase